MRLLARHPAVTLTMAMSSGATSAPRPLPALARIWDGAVAPLDVDRLAADADIVFLALPEAASAEVGAALLERGARVIDLSGAFRIRNDADRQRWYPATAALPQGVVYGLPERHAGADSRRPAGVLSRLLPDRRAPGAGAAGDGGPARRPRRRGREVGHLRRRQDAERSHALLREPRQRRRLRRLLAPAHGGDRAGAEDAR